MLTALKTVSTTALSLLICAGVQTSARAQDQAQIDQTEKSAYHTTGYLRDNAAETFSDTLVISTHGTNWVKEDHSPITLIEGNLIVIAGKQPLAIKTAAGEASIPAGLAVMVQQKSDNPVRISMIGVRGKVASPNCSDWVITVTTSDNAVYKLGFGDVLLVASGEDVADAVVVQQSPAARKVMREAAHQLNSIVLALDVNGTLLADKIANDCTGTLLSLTQGSIVPEPEQLKHSVDIFVDDGSKFIAVQPGSVFQRPADTTLVVARKE